VETWGFEVELFAAPVSGLNIRGGVGYLDSEYTELDPGATITRDHKLVKAPEWTANAALDYTIPLDIDGAVIIGADLSYRDEYANELTNDPDLIQDSFTLWGAFLKYAAQNGLWSITVFGLNLGDERYMTNGINSDGSFGNSAANYGPPREWGVRLEVNL
jgi:iron complex outermembrane receptor protein